jgi:prepilin-type N-terminal cleavage/methylation domain-containing protein
MALEPRPRTADTFFMRTHLRAEAGFGLVELLIAMTVLAVALLALVAAFSSGALTLQRASQTSTASAIANQQMELYRGLKYCAIRLDDASVSPLPPAPYSSDAAYSGTQVLDTGLCGGAAQPCAAGPPPECAASRNVTGPDNRPYRVDTYIVYETPSGGRQLKKVTVVIRDRDKVTAGGLVRTSSKFDEISG